MEHIGNRQIVNAGHLPRFIGKKISINGFVTDVSATGGSFSIRSTDNQVIPINLKTPLDRPVEGYVEVRGTSQGKSVLADDFILFENRDFDQKAHNTLCTLLSSVPNLWETGTAE